MKLYGYVTCNGSKRYMSLEFRKWLPLAWKLKKIKMHQTLCNFSEQITDMCIVEIWFGIFKKAGLYHGNGQNAKNFKILQIVYIFTVMITGMSRCDFRLWNVKNGCRISGNGGTRVPSVIASNYKSSCISIGLLCLTLCCRFIFDLCV